MFVQQQWDITQTQLTTTSQPPYLTSADGGLYNYQGCTSMSVYGVGDMACELGRRDMGVPHNPLSVTLPLTLTRI